MYGFSLWAMNGCLMGREGRMFSCVWRMDFIHDCSLEIWGLEGGMESGFDEEG